MADTCGSLTAVALILGSVCGAGRNEGDNTAEKLHYCMDRAREFYSWFKAQQGFISCNEILIQNAGGIKYDFTDRQDIIRAFEAGVLEKCKDLVRENAGKAAEMLWDELHKKGRRV
jgi:nucleoside-diphosphate-sugar epimerase